MVTSAAYLALLGVLAFERLRELRRSTKNARRLRARGAVEVGRGHYPAMVGLHALLFPACAAERIARGRSAGPLVTLASLAGLALAHRLRYAAVRALGDRWTTRILVLPGAPRIRNGPYRHLRHPNYLAVAIEVVCIPLAGGCWWSAGLFSLANALLLTVRIFTEERALLEAGSQLGAPAAGGREHGWGSERSKRGTHPSAGPTEGQGSVASGPRRRTGGPEAL